MMKLPFLGESPDPCLSHKRTNSKKRPQSALFRVCLLPFGPDFGLLHTGMLTTQGMCPTKHHKEHRNQEQSSEHNQGVFSRHCPRPAGTLGSRKSGAT